MWRTSIITLVGCFMACSGNAEAQERPKHIYTWSWFQLRTFDFKIRDEKFDYGPKETGVTQNWRQDGSDYHGFISAPPGYDICRAKYTRLHYGKWTRMTFNASIVRDSQNTGLAVYAVVPVSKTYNFYLER